VLQRWQAAERRRFRENAQIEADRSREFGPAQVRKRPTPSKVTGVSAASSFQENYAESAIEEECRSMALSSRGYLRASGCQSDLVMEGFERKLSTASWAVIVGGRAGRLAKPNPSAALFLMKRVGS